MIRHTPSFLISIIIHSLLLVAFFYTYTYISSLKSDKKDEELCLKLTCIVEEHNEHVKEKPKPKPKKVIPPKPKPKVEKPKKEVVEKIIPKPLTVPVVKEIVEPEEEPEVVYIEPVKEEQVTEEVFPVESQEEKSIAREQQYMDEHIKKIIRLLSENLYYPRSARKRGVVGEVLVKFSLSKDATVSKIEIISSESDILSRAARKTIEDLSGEFPRPNEELVLHVPINYELTK